jgi:hypothetical protein
METTTKRQALIKAINEHEIFHKEVRQLLYEKAKNVYRVLFTIRGTEAESAVFDTMFQPL